ncbi:MAG: hypothetical protein KAY32_09890 [Candidatus Eisenbacteria sp.]|nr:hypothetical protein [Candidatus Eisenbacteria bacterium]
MARKSFIAKMFGKRQKLDDLDLDRLNRERLRLKREEQKVVQRIGHIERDKAALFEQAVGVGSKRQRTMVARQIKELDASAKHDEALSRALSKQIRILNGIIKLKQDREFRERFGMLGLLKEMDVAEIAVNIEKVAIDGELTDEKLAQVLQALEEGDSMMGQKEDPDIESIVAAIEETAAAATEGQEEATTKGFAKVNEILAEEQQEAGRELEQPELA